MERITADRPLRRLLPDRKAMTPVFRLAQSSWWEFFGELSGFLFWLICLAAFSPPLSFLLWAILLMRALLWGVVFRSYLGVLTCRLLQGYPPPPCPPPYPTLPPLPPPSSPSSPSPDTIGSNRTCWLAESLRVTTPPPPGPTTLALPPAQTPSDLTQPVD